MTDITNTNLTAALIDQHVAGAFHGRAYAYVPVVATGGWQLGVAVRDEQGYSPIQGKTFAHHGEAKLWANGLNAHIGLTTDEAVEIVCSSMRVRFVR